MITRSEPSTTRHERPTRSAMSRARDRMLAFDPGWARMRMGVIVLAVVLATIGVEWLFVGQTHAMQIDTHGARLPTAQAAKVGFANHAAIVAAGLTGASAGLLSLVALADARPRRIVLTLLVVSAMLMAGLTFGLGLDRHHEDLGLASVVVTLTLSCYLRRYGLIGFAAGIALFSGTFSGRQSAAREDLGDLGWLAAEMGLGLLTALVVLMVLFRARPHRALTSVGRGYVARTRRALELAVRQFEAPSNLRRNRLQRALARVNETAVAIDAQLAKPGSLGDGASAQNAHHRLFDIELATTNLVRASAELGTADVPPDVRLAVVTTLRALAAGELEQAWDSVQAMSRPDAPAAEGRFTRSVIHLVDSLTAWQEVDMGGDTTDFTPAVLMGSTTISAAASEAPADPAFRGWAAVRLNASTRLTIQMGVAATVTLFVSRALSADHFYWALIAVFVTFLGTSNAGEQVSKAVYRAAGTAVGVIAGSVLGHAVGAGHWHASLVLLLIALFWAFTFAGVNYGVAVIGITVMASQLYVQLGEFSDSLLDLRLKETALGAGIAVLTVALVVPLRTRRVLSLSFDEYRTALVEVTDCVAATADLGGEVRARSDGDVPLPERMRRLDIAFQTLIATAGPTRMRAYATDRFDPASIKAVAARTHSDSRQMIATLRDAGQATDASTRAGLLDLVRQDLADVEQTLRTVEGTGSTVDRAGAHHSPAPG